MVGICICERHGRAGLADVCEHLALAVSSRSTPPQVITIKFNFGEFAAMPGADMVLMNMYCRNCAEEFGFPPSSGDLPASEWQPMIEAGRFTGLCSTCLSDAVGSQQVEQN